MKNNQLIIIKLINNETEFKINNELIMDLMKRTKSIMN